MDLTRGHGVYVRSLFQLLVLLQIPQRDVCRHLGLSATFVSLMAKGRRPMPRKHLEAFEQFLADAMDRKNAMYLQRIHEVLGPERAQTYLRLVPVTPESPTGVADPGPDAPTIVRQWWAYHLHHTQLLLQWAMEVNPGPFSRAAQGLCGKLAQYHLLDAEKFDEMFLSSRREELVQMAEELLGLARAIGMVDVNPMVDRLRARLQPKVRRTRAAKVVGER